MNFNSLSYLAFLAVNIPVYYLLPGKLRNLQLLIASYLFYMCWNPQYALLMLFSTAVTYWCGLLVGWQALGKRKLWLALSLLINLVVLFFFKYFNFAASLLSRVLGILGLSFSAPVLDVLLPVGISFYTFQALGYTVDVYRKDVAAERNFIDYALFVSFFPQLVAGPIERSGHMLAQIREYHPFRAASLREGFFPVLCGLFKKMVLADNLAVLVNTVYSRPQNHTGGEFALATLAFAFQIYCDFSAYSDIARGSAKMLGYDLMENFRCPYLAVSIQDFWRRWHISLSTWFRDYLYFPLGGGRRGKWRNCLNILIVFAISGLWHGAALSFVAWGLLNGLYMVGSRLLRPARERWFVFAHIRRDSRWLHLFRIVFTFLLVCLSWVLFRAESFSEAGMIFSALFRIPMSGFTVDFRQMGLSVPALIVVAVLTPAFCLLDWLITEKHLLIRLNRMVFPRYCIYFVLIVLILLFGSYGTGYDPQDFVYFQF